MSTVRYWFIRRTTASKGNRRRRVWSTGSVLKRHGVASLRCVIAPPVLKMLGLGETQTVNSKVSTRVRVRVAGCGLLLEPKVRLGRGEAKRRSRKLQSELARLRHIKERR